MALPPGTRIGPYEVVALLGSGGMGEIYRATDRRLGRDVAVKVLREAKHASRDREARFEREARLLASINHPNIATIHGLEDLVGSTAIVMELVDGPSLADLIARGPIGTAESARIAIQIADGMSGAHALRIVHRDLKPSNVRIAPGGRVKILDLGLAKMVASDSGAALEPTTREDTETLALETREGTLLGTAAYMSPEQAVGAPVDARTDVWAFGAVVFEMLSGRRAFPGRTITDTLAAVLRGAVDWEALPADVPREVRGLIERCLVREASGRLSDLGEARDALRQFADSGFTAAARGGDPAGIRPSLSLPDKPSIAVLPFSNLSGDPEQDYFADGMVEDIVTGLSRIKWLFVIARNSSLHYKGKAVDAKQVGRELGVRYILEGSVRRSANRVRVAGQLIDTASGTHIWAERYDRALDDIFALQDDLTISVIGAIEPTLRQAEIERARRKRPENLDAYDLYLRALPFTFTAMPQNAEKALALLEKAIELDPDYSAAHAMIAWCHEQRYLRSGLYEEEKRAALHHAREAIARGGDDAEALAIAGFVIAVVEYDYETAIAVFDRSFALSSSSALALGFSSIVRAWKGDDMAAVEHAERAIRLSPFDRLLYLPFVGLAYAHFASSRFGEAADAASRAAQSNPSFSMPYVLHAAALANLGRIEQASAIVARLLDVQPDLKVATAVRSARYANPDRNAALADALRRAGLPE